MESVKPQKFGAKLRERQELAGGFYSLVFELIEPAVMNFVAGQFVSIKVDEAGTRRSYSIASGPERKGEIELGIKVFPGGKGSEFFKALEIGGEVEMLGPMGRFVMQGTGDKLLFVATGSGIVPIRSMVQDALRVRGDKRQMWLSWGMRSRESLYWVDEFMSLQADFGNFKFDLVLSQPNTDWQYCRGHIGNCLVGHKPNWQGWEAYICGNRGMIEETKKLLVEKGIGEDKVYFEKFY